MIFHLIESPSSPGPEPLPSDIGPLEDVPASTKGIKTRSHEANKSLGLAGIGSGNTFVCVLCDFDFWVLF